MDVLPGLSHALLHYFILLLYFCSSLLETGTKSYARMCVFIYRQVSFYPILLYRE